VRPLSQKLQRVRATLHDGPLKEKTRRNLILTLVGWQMAHKL